MQTYETIFITRPTLTEDEEKAAVEGLAESSTDSTGQLSLLNLPPQPKPGSEAERRRGGRKGGRKR